MTYDGKQTLGKLALRFHTASSFLKKTGMQTRMVHPITMKTILLLTLAVLTSCSAGTEKNGNPVEVGKITWLRDLPTALDLSKSTGKPVFLLFQEVPGCAGCKQFGKDVLSDPAIVKSVEENFVPLLIHNNKGGKDAEVLRKYNEPAWNYQVVRFLDSSGEDLIPRKDRIWTKEALEPRIEAALKKAGKPQAANGPATKKLAICQSCFWTGEMKIGAIPGVTETEAGFIGGREVTLVNYDPTSTSLRKIIAQAKSDNVATAIYLENPANLPGSKKLTGYRPAPVSDQKKQIQNTIFAQLDLTPEQATKVNAYARTNPRKALEFLTPNQRQQINQ